MLLSTLTALAVILLDFITKHAVKASMTLGESFEVIPGLFNITYVLNKGAAWGMLADKRWIFLSFSIIAIVIVAVILYRVKKDSRFLRVSLSLILGGGIGNMIDRTFYGEKLFEGAVIDFIEAAFIDFPVFNIADSAVVIGAIMLFVYILFLDKGRTAKSEENKDE